MEKIKNYLYYNRKELITILICFIIFISYIIFKNNDNNEIIELTNNIEKEKIDETIIIDIKGEVNSPGTYEFNTNERIMDAIKKSGGLTDKADVSNINLSEKLSDEMLIIIPSIDEKQIIENNKNESNNIKEINKQDNKISINTASVNELMKIKGIGKVKAEAIVKYRNNNGLFHDIKEIIKVSGIGNSTYEKIKAYIKI